MNCYQGMLQLPIRKSSPPLTMAGEQSDLWALYVFRDQLQKSLAESSRKSWLYLGAGIVTKWPLHPIYLFIYLSSWAVGTGFLLFPWNHRNKREREASAQTQLPVTLYKTSSRICFIALKRASHALDLVSAKAHFRKAIGLMGAQTGLSYP